MIRGRQANQQISAWHHREGGPSAGAGRHPPTRANPWAEGDAAVPLWVGMARAPREWALSILLRDKSGARRPRAYWNQPENAATYAHRMGVLWESTSTRFMQDVNDPWETQEVNGPTLHFEPDGSWRRFAIAAASFRAAASGPDGKRRRVTVYAKKKREVLAKLHKLQQDGLQGLPVKPEKVTVEQHLRDWLAQKKRQVRSGTYLKYESHLLTHVIPAFGILRLRDLDYWRINALYATLEEKGLAPATVADVASILRSALEDAVVKGLIVRNPAKMRPKPSAPREEARFLTQEEVHWLLGGAKGERLEAGFVLALHTGMRPGEWLGLPWEAVDLGGGTVTVREALHEEKGRVFLGPVKTTAACGPSPSRRRR